MSTSPPDSDLSFGLKIVKSVAYRDRVADLYKGDPTGHLVGHRFSIGSENQQFRFTKVPGVNKYTISTTSTTGWAYITSQPDAGAPVTAGGGTVYTVTPANPDPLSNFYHISVEESKGQNLYWCLSIESEDAGITLQRDDRGRLDSNLIWKIYSY